MRRHVRHICTDISRALTRASKHNDIIRHFLALPADQRLELVRCGHPLACAADRAMATLYDDCFDHDSIHVRNFVRDLTSAETTSSVGREPFLSVCT